MCWRAFSCVGEGVHLCVLERVCVSERECVCVRERDREREAKTTRIPLAQDGDTCAFSKQRGCHAKCNTLVMVDWRHAQSLTPNFVNCVSRLPLIFRVAHPVYLGYRDARALFLYLHPSPHNPRHTQRLCLLLNSSSFSFFLPTCPSLFLAWVPASKSCFQRASVRLSLRYTDMTGERQCTLRLQESDHF